MKTSFVKGIAKTIHSLTDESLFDILPKQRGASVVPGLLGAFALGAVAGFASSFILRDEDREKIRATIKENLSNVTSLFDREKEMVEGQIKKAKAIIRKSKGSEAVGNEVVEPVPEAHDN